MQKHFMESDSFGIRLDTKLMIAKIEHNKKILKKQRLFKPMTQKLITTQMMYQKWISLLLFLKLTWSLIPIIVGLILVQQDL